MVSGKLFYQIGMWAPAFLALIVLEHALPIIHPVLGLIQIPLLVLFGMYLFGISSSIVIIFAIGFLSDAAMFSPDGVYFITILSFFIISLLFSRTFHVETYLATVIYLTGGTILFFLLLAVSYSIALWFSDSSIFVMNLSPASLAASLGINLVLILAIYAFIEFKRKGAAVSFR